MCAAQGPCAFTRQSLSACRETGPGTRDDTHSDATAVAKGLLVDRSLFFPLTCIVNEFM